MSAVQNGTHPTSTTLHAGFFATPRTPRHGCVARARRGSSVAAGCLVLENIFEKNSRRQTRVDHSPQTEGTSFSGSRGLPALPVRHSTCCLPSRWLATSPTLPPPRPHVCVASESADCVCVGGSSAAAQPAAMYSNKLAYVPLPSCVGLGIIPRSKLMCWTWNNSKIRVHLSYFQVPHPT